MPLPTDQVLLKNGQREIYAAVVAISHSLDALSDSDLTGALAVIDILDLVTKAKPITSQASLALLKQANLLDASGRLHDSVRNIIHAMTVGQPEYTTDSALAEVQA